MLPISHLEFQAILPFKSKALMYSKVVRAQVRSGILNHRLLEAYLKTSLAAFSRSLFVVLMGSPGLSHEAESCWQCPVCLGTFCHLASCKPPYFFHIPGALRKQRSPGLPVSLRLYLFVPSILHFHLYHARVSLRGKTTPCSKRKITYGRGTLQVPNERPKPYNSLGALPKDTSNYITKEKKKIPHL